MSMDSSDLSVLMKHAHGKAAVLIFAASARAPAFEAQMGVLEEESDLLEQDDVVVGTIFEEGESSIGSERLKDAEAAALRRAMDLEDEEFQVIVVDRRGVIVKRDDAPLQGHAILRAAGGASS